MRIGLLGASRIAPTAIIEPANSLPGAHVSAVAARDRSKAEAFARTHGIPHVFDGYAALIASPDVDLVYMYGKLSKAVEILATNHGDVKNRVWVAAPELSMVQAAGLPESLHDDINWIHAMMNRYPADHIYKSTLQATYHRTRNVTAERIARRVWTLFHLMQTEIEARRYR